MYNDPKQFTGSYNFGPDSGEMHTVEDLAKELVKIWGAGEITITKKEDDPPEAGLLHLNCDKAHHYLGWHSKWNFKKTVEQTAKWYKSVKYGESAKTITKQQIIEYMES
jgi:CDP-glucose 4,6-dehydratase